MCVLALRGVHEASVDATGQSGQRRRAASLRMRHAVPYGLHGTFVDEYFGP